MFAQIQNANIGIYDEFIYIKLVLARNIRHFNISVLLTQNMLQWIHEWEQLN